MKIGIVGISGRMGMAIVNSILHENNNDMLYISTSATKDSGDVKLTEFLKNNTHERIIKDAMVTDNIEQVFIEADVVIDFSCIEGLLECLKYAAKYQKPLVSGVTGMTDDIYKKILECSRHTKVNWSPNMSIAINVVNEVLKKLGNTFKNHDCEIIEYHHKMKKDAPSGTALLFGQSIAESRSVEFEQVANFNRLHDKSIRNDQEIGFSSIRGGNIFGTNEVMFIDQNEIITIKHEANNRSIFANGAITAAISLYNRPEKTGFFAINKLLHLENLL